MGIKWINKDIWFKRLLSIVPKADVEMGKANKISAEHFVAQAKALAPVGHVRPRDPPGYVPGKLRDSIHYSPGKRQGSFIVRAGGITTTNPKTNYDYAAGQEFGNKTTKRHPFFWPAFRLNKRPMKDRARRALNKAIKDAGLAP